jgi:nucleoside-diphosphate-sugar epimerase
MKIAVIGANGRSGRAFVTAALTAGHQVNAGVHTTSSMTQQPGLRVYRCDATNPEEVKELIQGQDAVVSLIGHVKGSSASVQTDSIKNIIQVMQAQKVTRLISLTGTGVRFPGDRISLSDRFLNFGISLIDPKRISDGKEHVRQITMSNLDWTILRVLKLQTHSRRKYTLTENGPTKLFVSREDVADSILLLLSKNSFIKKAPIISRA